MEPICIPDIKAIDFHSHFGEWNREVSPPASYVLVDSTYDYLLENMTYANISISINSHLYGVFPRGNVDAVKGNLLGIEAAERLPGVYLWAVVNPLQPASYDQAAWLVKKERCLGIKIHPEEHRYPIMEYGKEIYEFAARHHAAILTHSGEEWSKPEDFCIFANRYPEVKTIIAHLGLKWDGDFRHQIRAIQSSVQDNLFTDTSSAQTMNCNIIETAVAEIGSEKILFGTDSGCYFSPCHRARVNFARIGIEDKLNILYRNGLRIFPQLEEVYRRLC
jgi:predicted TIM-barrel fold metal-dependent hydrolase